MDNSFKYGAFLILLIPLILIYYIFFNIDFNLNSKFQTESIVPKNEVFNIDTFNNHLYAKDYLISQKTKTYKLGSTLKSKPAATAIKNFYLDNGVLINSTLNIDNSVIVLYPSDVERIYLFKKDKTYFKSNTNPYGDKLSTINEDNSILMYYKDINEHLDVKKISENVFEYSDYLEIPSDTTEADRLKPEFKKVYEEKLVFKFEFKNNLLFKHTIVSNDGKYIIGSVEYTYTEITQDTIDKNKSIPSDFTEVVE